MFRGNKKAVANIVKVAMILALLVFTIKPFEAARPLDNMKSKPDQSLNVSVSQVRAPVPPSASNPSTYIPGPNDEGCS